MIFFLINFETTTSWIDLGQSGLTYYLHIKIWDHDNSHRKQIKINHETQFPINPMLKDETKKK